MKKDNYLQTLMAAPPKQKMQIQFIDPKTLREGFSVTLTGLPSYNKASLEGTDPKEKEAKKLKVRLPSLSAGRRTSLAAQSEQKERRKAEKEERLRRQQRAQGSGSNTSTPAAATPSSVTHVRNVSANTPSKSKPPVVARPSPTRPGTPAVSASGTQPNTAPTPTPPHQTTVPAAGGRLTSNPTGATGRPPQANGIGATNVNTVTEKRGKKRELEVHHPPTPGQVPQKKRRVVRIFPALAEIFLTGGLRTRTRRRPRHCNSPLHMDRSLHPRAISSFAGPTRLRKLVPFSTISTIMSIS